LLGKRCRPENRGQSLVQPIALQSGNYFSKDDSIGFEGDDQRS
jgi:hypothetical protein